MAKLLETLEGPIPRPVLWIGGPVVGVLLVSMFVFLGFPYDDLAELATRRVGQATGTQLTIGEIDPQITIGGPGFRARDITVTTGSKQVHRIDSLYVRPAWSFSWLTGHPAVHLDAETAIGRASGMVRPGQYPAWDMDLEDVDFARLPIPLPSEISLRGLVSGNLDIVMSEAGPDGSVDLEASDGSLSHPMLPIEIEYDSMLAQLTFGGEHFAQVEQIELDGPTLTAKIRGTIGQGADMTSQPLSMQIEVHIKDRTMQSMLRQFGVKLQPDGRTQFEVGGTAGNPTLL